MAFSLNFICFCILFTTRRSFQPGWQSQNCFCSSTVLMRRYASHLRFDSGWSLLCLSFLLPQSPAHPLLSLLVSLLSSATVSRATEQPGDRSSDRALSTGRPIHAGGFLVMDSYETFETIPPNIIKQNPFLCFLFFEYTSYRKYRHLQFHI
jgi:hypothetical protein